MGTRIKAVNPLMILIVANENKINAASVGTPFRQIKNTINQASTVFKSDAKIVRENVNRSQASLDRFNSSSPFGVMQTLENTILSFPVTIQSMNFSFESIRNS